MRQIVLALADETVRLMVACLGSVALRLDGDERDECVEGAVRADDGVGGALAEAGEGVEALEGRDEEVDVVQGQVRDQGVEEGTLPRQKRT